VHSTGPHIPKLTPIGSPFVENEIYLEKLLLEHALNQPKSFKSLPEL